jgi:acyl-CoA reductase-like NAD-dependent aldehyde dehydrogenase
MASIDSTLVERIVRQVVTELEQNPVSATARAVTSVTDGVFDDMNTAITATAVAQEQWRYTSRDTRSRVIEALRAAMHEHADEFARRTLEETGMGRLEDKIFKAHNVADVTPGLEDLETRSWIGDKGMVMEDYAPYGVIAAITPSTHPIPVLLNSTIIMIAPGNGVVFNVHPAAKKVSVHAMRIFNAVIQEHGGPANLISMVAEPTLESAHELFHDSRIPMIVATGGPGPVKAAFEAQKKVVAAGPGNPPVLIDDTADLDEAAQYTIEGAGFDNNIICIAEKEIFVVESVFDAFMQAMERAGAVRLNGQQIDALTRKAILTHDKSGEQYPSRDYIGKNAAVLGAAAGLSLSDDVRVLFGETDFDHPFVQVEQMMPFLPVVRVPTAEQGLELSYHAEHGFGHTAVIHSNNLDLITRFTRKLDTDIIVVNGPSLSGLGPHAGESYFSHTLASPTGEGVCTPRNFARIRRLATYKTMNVV